MASTKTPLPKSPAVANEKTEADMKSFDKKSGKRDESSHDEKSHDKAGKDTGAGGGKKQERKH